jgi:hypothetical protein
LSQQIKKLAQQPNLWGSILISLFYFASNSPNNCSEILLFLHNFLTLNRYFMNQNLPKHFEYSVKIALTIKESIIPLILPNPTPVIDFFTHSTFLFQNDYALNSQNFSKYLIEVQERENQLMQLCDKLHQEINAKNEYIEKFQNEELKRIKIEEELSNQIHELQAIKLQSQNQIIQIEGEKKRSRIKFESANKRL